MAWEVLEMSLEGGRTLMWRESVFGDQTKAVSHIHLFDGIDTYSHNGRRTNSRSSIDL